MEGHPSVPVLDLSAPEDEVAVVCHRACVDHGFFYVTNHGVDQSLIDGHAAAQRQFFSLPLERKMTILADENNRGYTPLAEETLDPANSSAGDAKEGLYYGRDVSPDSPEAQLPLHGPNQWPAEDLLPGYRATVEAYMEAMRCLGFRLLRILALSLNLPAEFFHKFFERPMLALRPLHYTAQVSNESAGQFAAGAHSDYGFCTLLYAPTPGLQIFGDGNRWEDVPPLEGAFIVNLGDMLERWTSKKYASTLHRVVNPTGVERYSCAYFFEPSFDTLVEALPGCCSSDRVGDDGEVDKDSRKEAVPLFPPITSGEYLLSRYAETHAGYRDKMVAGVAKT